MSDESSSATTSENEHPKNEGVLSPTDAQHSEADAESDALEPPSATLESEAALPATEKPTKVTSKKLAKKQSSGKTGVIYLSRVPPGMELTSLRSLLSRAGPTGRIWLRPADEEGTTGGQAGSKPESKRRRKRQTTFRDGWVEFHQRRDAKRAVALLNGQAMAGAKKKGRFANDLWAMRLLPGFTWDDLGQEVFGSARERVLQVREEVASARRERAWVERRVDIGKHVARKRKRRADAKAVREGSGDELETDVVKVVRRFRQKEAVEDDDDVRARLAAESVDRDLQSGVKRKIDGDLVAKLFKKRRTESV